MSERSDFEHWRATTSTAIVHEREVADLQAQLTAANEEVERLRELVEKAFREGWGVNYGRIPYVSPKGNQDHDWQDSEAKDELGKKVTP